LQDAARSQGVTLQIRDIRSGDDLPAAFDAGVKERAQGLLTTAESIFFVHRARLTELAARHRLPAIYPFSTAAEEAGGLMAYDVNRDDLYRRSATYVDRMLKGAKPSELPVQQPTKFDFVINLKTAKTLGLTFPPGLLAIADRVVE
jgi:putative tryptophan/tyrosine transport system substrate-binding protein